MKWNWGTKLLLAMIVFMGFILGLVYFSTRNDILLVEKDYYPKGLKYQHRIDAISNGKRYYDQVSIKQVEKNILVHFPLIKPDSGKLVFFRPSDDRFDKSFDIVLDSSYSMLIQGHDFVKGKYRLKISWVSDSSEYFIEKQFDYKNDE